MVRLTLSRMVMVMVVVVESLYLMVVLQKMAELEMSCGDPDHDQDEDEDDDENDLVDKEEMKKEPWPPLYVITPTYKRNTQLADLTRLAQTLMHVPALHWIVVEDAEHPREVVGELLVRSGLPFTHLSATTPPEYKDAKMMGRGVFNRREGLRWVREHATEGVLYFADDDNTYDIRIFEQMRGTRRASVFPVGMILSLGISSPVVRDGKVVAFHDGFQAGRKFAVDMAGFAVNLRVVHASPGATIPIRVSYLEDGFLRQLRLELEDLEPLAWGCTQVLVWHTRTNRPATPNMDHVTKDHLDTNLVHLYRNILR